MDPPETHHDHEAKMLPPFIIEQIRKREERQTQEELRPVLEVPLPQYPDEPSPSVSPQQEKPERGIVILDL